MKELLKKAWPYVAAVAVIFAVAMIYMSPVLDDKVIVSSDGIQARCMNHETVQYHEQTGEYSWWLGSMFSGMPAYQTGGGHYLSGDWLRPLNRVLLWGHRNCIAIVVIYCLCFFALLLSLRINKWLALVGAFAIAFSSYFFIIIAANHHSKTSSLALMSLAVAGCYLIYQRKYLLGAVLTMVGTAIGMYPHPQMAYYVCFIMGFFVLAELYQHAIEKRWKQFAGATFLLIASFAVGMGTGSAATFANMEYASQTMRGGHSDLAKASDASNKTSGLDLDYATAWSYGQAESFTFLIPNFMGGSSSYELGDDSSLYQAMVKRGVPRSQTKQFCKNAPMYWGEQPFTSGPVYMGAIVCFLFVLSLFLLKGPYKWALLAATVLSLGLSWGKNMMWLTSLFFDLVPMYNKFRTVSSILVIAEITMPLLGFLALKAIADKQIARQKLNRAIYWSAGITGGLCLVMALFGSSLFNFESANDARLFSQLPDWMASALVAQRAELFTTDCWRSLLFIVLGAALVWAYVRYEFQTALFALGLGALILGDMWPVDKRFMNDGMFVKQRDFSQSFAMQPYEKLILQDKDPHFRVFNLTTNTFNDARTSYYLKSIGGYHAAKLRRYQDIIDQHLSQMNMKVVNMLNAKYIITKGIDGQPTPQLNPKAMGNAWFVDSLVMVDNANQESAALNTLDLRTTAVVDKQFAAFTHDFVAGHDSTAVVRLTQYTPEYIEYESSSTKPGTIVFSEVYYPFGWNAYVDGVAVDHYRVNYILRALNVQAGQHHIRFEFRPQSVEKGDTLAMVCIILMYLTIAAAVIYGVVCCVRRANSEKGKRE